jgi:hypothetical protein
MGYTHYWNPPAEINQNEWDEFVSTAKEIAIQAQADGIKLTGWDGEEDTLMVFDKDKISFNGLDDEAHESFVINRVREGSFDFCKTNRKPYDAVCVAILELANQSFDGYEKFTWSSDGDKEDFYLGFALLAITRSNQKVRA